MASAMKYLLLVAALASCGIDRDIEKDITIDRGVYGLLVRGCDTSGCKDQVDDHEAVTIMKIGQPGTLQTVMSDGNGVYQVSLPADTYQVCTYNCVTIDVPDHGTVRADWTSGPGGGDWDVH